MLQHALNNSLEEHRKAVKKASSNLEDWALQHLPGKLAIALSENCGCT
jgi:hypothetical protein